MATSIPARKKSAEDELLESFGDLIDEAAEKMTDKEFEKAAKKSTATLDRAIAVHSRRRGTA
jgi:F0F1-type ATP synthase membrane subunit b/b'